MYGHKKSSFCFACDIIWLRAIDQRQHRSDRYSQAEYWIYNMQIYAKIYILIDLCSVEARVIISTGSTKFHPVTILLFAYFQDGRQS